MLVNAARCYKLLCYTNCHNITMNYLVHGAAFVCLVLLCHRVCVVLVCTPCISKFCYESVSLFGTSYYLLSSLIVMVLSFVELLSDYFQLSYFVALFTTIFQMHYSISVIDNHIDLFLIAASRIKLQYITIVGYLSFLG